MTRPVPKKVKVELPAPTPAPAAAPAAAAPAAAGYVAPVAGLVHDEGRARRDSTRAATEERNREPPRVSPYPARDDERPGLDPTAVADLFPRVTEPDIYDGDRGSLFFYPNVEESMALVPMVCKKPGCHRTDGLEIDHIRPFSERIGFAATSVYCYGSRHWKAVEYDRALKIYNEELNPATKASTGLVEGHFQWMCDTHNGGKGGNTGIDSSGPVRSGPCPADGGECGTTKLIRARSQRRKHQGHLDAIAAAIKESKKNNAGNAKADDE
jgi:hypothetical protein